MASQNEGTHDKGGGRRKRRIWTILFVIFLTVLIVSVGLFALLNWSYYDQEQTYESIATEAFEPAANTGGGLAEFSIDWDYLRSVNPEVVAWVYVPGTVIDYPVAHTTDNDKYLHAAFNGDPGIMSHYGTIFLDASNKPDFSDSNNVLYGHHMNNGSMFACLSTQLTDESEFNAHRTVYVLTPTMNYRCESFSLVLTNGYDSLAQTSFRDVNERFAYLQAIEDRSCVQPEGGMPLPTRIGKTFMLSTCDYSQSNGRAVLFARVVEAAVPGVAGGVSAVTPEDAAAISEAVGDVG